MSHKHKWQFRRQERECIDHKMYQENGICMQLDLGADPKGGRHRDYLYFVCECGDTKKVETKKSKNTGESK